MHVLSSRAKLFASLALLLAPQACAQFTDPRNYQNTPVGVNLIEFSYAYAHANASLDPSLVIGGAKLDLNQGAITYYRYFGLFGHTAWFSPSLPLAGLNGSVPSANLTGSVAGAGDSSYQFAVLLKGGPALRVADFANYTQTTGLAVSLTASAPTGLYDANRILNLGSDRWSFKPEFALTHPFGPQQNWVVDAYANCYFYTDNTSYRGTQILRQRPLPGLEAHLSRSLGQNVVASLDTRYSFRGNTFIDGVDQDSSQKNFVIGSEAIVSLNDRNTLAFIFEKALVHENGPAATGFAVRYEFAWGGGLK